MTTPKTKTRGRKTLLNATLQKQICSALADGNLISTSCALAGIATSTFYDWQQRGEQGEKKFVEFSEAVTRARAEAKQRLVKIIFDAAKTDARHAQWLLERSFRAEYGRDAEPEPKPKPITSDRGFATLMDDMQHLPPLPPL